MPLPPVIVEFVKLSAGLDHSDSVVDSATKALEAAKAKKAQANKDLDAAKLAVDQAEAALQEVLNEKETLQGLYDGIATVIPLFTNTPTSTAANASAAVLAASEVEV